jgi:hypothetical protein
MCDVVEVGVELLGELEESKYLAVCQFRGEMRSDWLNAVALKSPSPSCTLSMQSFD